MDTLKLVFVLIPALLEIVRLIEGLITEPKTGEQKKAAVIQIIKVVLTAGQKAGLLQKINVDALLAAVDVLIDTIVGIMNATGVFTHAGKAGAER